MASLRYVEPKKNPNQSTFSIVGRKNTQEDEFWISEKKHGQQLFLVADGVGGHGNGDFASKQTIAVFRQAFDGETQIEDIPNFLKNNALKAAETVLQKAEENPRFKNCGTTLTGFFIHQSHFYVINIGDSRVYQLTNNELTRLSKDHSKVQRLIDAGILTEAEAKQHPERNIMTSAIGQPLRMLAVDVSKKQQLLPNTVLMACSDGVHDGLKDTEIEHIIRQATVASKISETLVHSAYEAGSTDNITAITFSHF